jgi:hypothetical protein
VIGLGKFKDKNQMETAKEKLGGEPEIISGPSQDIYDKYLISIEEGQDLILYPCLLYIIRDGSKFFVQDLREYHEFDTLEKAELCLIDLFIDEV